MKIKVEQFCRLATSPSFQSWLFNYDGDMYRKFIARLHESRGCGENRELMKILLEEIQNNGGGNDITDFLFKHYPHIIEGNINTSDNNYEVFKQYNPHILTYPRRIIFTGPKDELKKKVRNFLLDKFKSDYIIIGDKAYVEYLEKSDADFAEQIPLSSWQIAAYRQK